MNRKINFIPDLIIWLPVKRQPRPKNILSENQIERLLSEPDVSKLLGLRNRAIMDLLYASYTTYLKTYLCDTYVENGADIRYIQEHLGHASVATTQIYTRVIITDLQRVFRETHPRAIKKWGFLLSSNIIQTCPLNKPYTTLQLMFIKIFQWARQKSYLISLLHLYWYYDACFPYQIYAVW